MVMRVETLSGIGKAVIYNLGRYEHHKVYIKVTNYVSTVTLDINDLTLGENYPINLRGDGNSIVLTGNGATSYLLENAKVERLQVNFISGDATLEISYMGW